MSVHPQAIDLGEMTNAPRSDSVKLIAGGISAEPGRRPGYGRFLSVPAAASLLGHFGVSATLLAWCAVIPTLWTAAMIVLSVNVRF